MSSKKEEVKAALAAMDKAREDYSLAADVLAISKEDVTNFSVKELLTIRDGLHKVNTKMYNLVTSTNNIKYQLEMQKISAKSKLVNKADTIKMITKSVERVVSYIKEKAVAVRGGDRILVNSNGAQIQCRVVKWDERSKKETCGFVVGVRLDIDFGKGVHKNWCYEVRVDAIDKDGPYTEVIKTETENVLEKYTETLNSL
jgi:hypothetical protein